MNNKSVTVLMTVYNNTAFIRESISSVLRQKEIEYDFLIIDDGSCEDIEKIINEFDDSRIRFIKFKKIGLIDALNEGIKQCHTKYLAIVDSDDIAPENRLLSQFNFLERNNSIGIVGTSIKYFTRKVTETTWSVNMPSSHYDIVKGLFKGRYVMVHSTVMLRTEIIRQITGYRKESYPVPDTDLFLRMSKLTNLANISNMYSFIRLHDKSITANNLRFIVEKNYNLINNSNISKISLHKNYYTLVNYRKGIINYLEKNYVMAVVFFICSFILTPQRAIYYIMNKMKFII